MFVYLSPFILAFVIGVSKKKDGGGGGGGEFVIGVSKKKDGGEGGRGKVFTYLLYLRNEFHYFEVYRSVNYIGSRAKRMNPGFM